MKFNNLATKFAHTLKKDPNFKIIGSKKDKKWDWVSRKHG